MRALAVVTPGIYEATDEHNRHMLVIDNLQIPLALVEGIAPEFDPNSEQFANLVLVKKTSFSLNYRDLGVIERAWYALKNTNMETYYPIGSDFAGYIEQVGKNVTQFQKGDLVIGDCFYPEPKEGVMPGIPSNHSSKEYEIYHQAKLIKVPENISNLEAGTLSIGTQTAQSMVRKANIKKGNKVLVTSVTSNTSFFLLNTLWGKDCEVYGLSYSGENIETVKNHFPFIKTIYSVKENNIPTDLLFDVVLDAFSDTHLPLLLQNLNIGARYLTCGIFNQSSHKITNAQNVNLSSLIASLMMKNIQFIGNCLGTSKDLEEGLKHYQTNKMVIDSVFNDSDSLTGFIERTYNYKQNKFGKVVFAYNN